MPGHSMEPKNTHGVIGVREKYNRTYFQRVTVYDRVGYWEICHAIQRNERVRSGLTLFRIRNFYNDDKKSIIRGFWSYWSVKSLFNYHMSAKVCRKRLCDLTAKFTGRTKYTICTVWLFVF